MSDRSATDASPGPRGIDADRVSDWFTEHAPGAATPLDFELVAGGHSNLTYRVTDAGGRRWALRRPPLGQVLATAHDMVREHRIISALAATDVPVPPVVGLCTDEAVNGAPFYVMEFVDGLILRAAEAGQKLTPEQRRRAGESLVDTMVAIHAVDVDAVGLGDLGRREDYIARQLKRWYGQWNSSKTRELPAVDEVHDHLVQNLPEQIGATIVHGDYRLDNCLITPEGEMAAVLDWEICTLGDPLADVGYLGVYWTDPGGEQLRHNDPSGAEGFPTYAELLDRYATRTGRDLSGIDYYVAFSSWRLAVISEGVYARYLHGAMGDQGVGAAELEQFRVGTEQLADAALEASRRL